VTADILPLALLAGALRVFRMHSTDQTFLLFERPSLDIWISALDAAATLALCFLGYRYGGLIGAVLGCVIASAITAAASLVVARLAFGYGLRVRDLAPICIALAAMTVAIASMRLEGTRPGLILEIALAGATYLFVLAALHPAGRRWMLARLARIMRPKRRAEAVRPAEEPDTFAMAAEPPASREGGPRAYLRSAV
jgi:O-antigen/teichoic acid export membrane protein